MGNWDVGYWGMPLGCRFHPTDQELISYLRQRAVAGKPLGIPFLREFNLYGNTQPWVVWENFGGNSFLDQDLFFFYELQHLKKHIKRSIDAGGSWSATAFAQVESLDGIPVGEKRNFCYKNKGCESDGDWLLEEYTLLPNPNLKVARNNVVLSRLKRSPKSRCANMNSTQQFNETPLVKKKARTEKQPIKKRARKELVVITNTTDQSNTPPIVPFDVIECNMNLDDNCISNINGTAEMPMNDVSTYPICFGSEEEILLGNEEYSSLREIEDLFLSFEGGDFPSDEESLLRNNPLLLDFDRWLETAKSPQKLEQLVDV